MTLNKIWRGERGRDAFRVTVLSQGLCAGSYVPVGMVLQPGGTAQLQPRHRVALAASCVIHATAYILH